MKKLLNVLGILLGILILLIATGALIVNVRGVPSYEVEAPKVTIEADSAMLANGERLVSMICAECHRGENTNALVGKKVVDIPKEFGEVYSSNITQHPEFGIGKYTAGELTYLLRTGVKRDGQYVPPYMPRFNNMSDYDMNSVIAYLQSDAPHVQPRAVEVPDCKPSFLVKMLSQFAFLPLPYDGQPVKKPALEDQLAYGEYVVHGMVACYECHSADFKTNNQLNPEQSAGYLGGGNRLLDYDGNVIPAPNLTMHPTGLGNWTEDQFIRAVKYGEHPDGPPIRYPMLKLSQLADEEVSAVWAYLQTVPKIDKEVPRPFYE